MMLADLSLPTYAFIAVGSLCFLYNLSSQPGFKRIPTVGPSDPILSFYGAWKYWFHAAEMIQEGYNKYRGGAFRIPMFRTWEVVVTGPQMTEELRKAKDDELSFQEAINDSIQIKYTMGDRIQKNGYHITIIRNKLTRNIGSLVPALHEEIVDAFNTVIPPQDGWISVSAMDAIMDIVARVSGRVFVGFPACRDPDYLDLNTKFTMEVALGGVLLGLLPWFTRPFFAQFVTHVPKFLRRAVQHLEPIVRERYECMERYGDDWPDRPNDMLQWLMEEAQGDERTASALTLRILVVNFASIHTSSMTFSNALYQLAANPQYIQPLRDEVEAVVGEEGWSKASLQKMRKMDSFLRECQRVHGLGCLVMSRKAMKDFTFSDGTFIPKGTIVHAAAAATHFDDEHYDNPFMFDPWRFENMRDESGEGTKHQMSNTSLSYVPFGVGRHACPGRFFAASELKAMMAYVVTTYDIKMENDGGFPKPIQFTSMSSPNRTAKVLFRKRQT